MAADIFIDLLLRAEFELNQMDYYLKKYRVYKLRIRKIQSLKLRIRKIRSLKLRIRNTDCAHKLRTSLLQHSQFLEMELTVTVCIRKIGYVQAKSDMAYPC